MEGIKLKNIRFGAVYCAPPIFCVDPHNMGYVEPLSLGISSSLARDIDAWNQELQKTFCDDYPPDSKFASIKERDDHNGRGFVLSRRLQEELGPDIEIDFLPLKE